MSDKNRIINGEDYLQLSLQEAEIQITARDKRIAYLEAIRLILKKSRGSPMVLSAWSLLRPWYSLDLCKKSTILGAQRYN